VHLQHESAMACALCVVDREYLGSMVGIGDTEGGGTARDT